MPKLTSTQFTIVLVSLLAAVVTLSLRGVLPSATTNMLLVGLVAWLVPSPFAKPSEPCTPPPKSSES